MGTHSNECVCYGEWEWEWEWEPTAMHVYVMVKMLCHCSCFGCDLALIRRNPHKQDLSPITTAHALARATLTGKM